MKAISILGSTGSVGVNTLHVVEAHPDKLRVAALACGSRVETLAAQALCHRPALAVVRDEARYAELRAALAGSGVRVAAGMDGMIEAACLPEVEMVVGAVVGGAGLLPVYRALEAGKQLALANKETLVMAGELMTAAAAGSGARILPVDSEHNALFQCLDGEDRRAVRRLILTASGGPFRRSSREEMEAATVAQALAHPTWKMGPKITIDSATLMNKGLEVIEAHHLFGLPASQIDVVIHPKSIVHSLVEFQDGSLLAELGTADMRIPIRYALSYPERWQGEEELRLDLASAGALEFEKPDRDRFPCLDLAYRTLTRASSARIALNAANEVAVAAFLDGRIPFGAIHRAIAATVAGAADVEPTRIAEVLELDGALRAAARGHVADAAETVIHLTGAEKP